MGKPLEVNAFQMICRFLQFLIIVTYHPEDSLCHWLGQVRYEDTSYFLRAKLFFTNKIIGKIIVVSARPTIFNKAWISKQWSSTHASMEGSPFWRDGCYRQIVHDNQLLSVRRNLPLYYIIKNFFLGCNSSVIWFLSSAKNSLFNYESYKSK